MLNTKIKGGEAEMAQDDRHQREYVRWRGRDPSWTSQLPFPTLSWKSQLTEHEGYYQWYSVSLIIRVTLTVHWIHVGKSLVLEFVLHSGGLAELITFFILDKGREDLFVTHHYQTPYVRNQEIYAAVIHFDPRRFELMFQSGYWNWCASVILPPVRLIHWLTSSTDDHCKS